MKKFVSVMALLLISSSVSTAAFAAAPENAQQLTCHFYAGQAYVTGTLQMYTWQPTPGATLNTSSTITVDRIMSQVSYRNTDGTTGSQSCQNYNSTDSGTAGVTDTEKVPGDTTFNGYSYVYTNGVSYGGSTFYNY